MKLKQTAVAAAIILLNSCAGLTTVKDMITDDISFEKHLSKDSLLSSVLKNKDKYRVQVIYTRIDRDENNHPLRTNFAFNVSDAYFYPASTVKLPTAILALQRLNELREKGVDRRTTINFGADFSGQTETTCDPKTAHGRPTIENYIKQILLVSDNAAYNRLYEFLGQEYINRELHEKGYTDAQIRHRLEIPLNNEENAATNPVKFLNASNQEIYSEPLKISDFKFKDRQDFIGKAYYKNNILVEEPMDFSFKNKLPLRDLHSTVQNLIFPSEKSFEITADDRMFLLKYMSMFPAESQFPQYGEDQHDAVAKFLFYGGTKGRKPSQIRIFNKVGDAYGQLTDSAYIADFDRNVEFILSATIYCNSNETLNDDQYDYETVGLPFMKALGENIYDYELSRHRKFQPDLSEFKFDYSAQ